MRRVTSAVSVVWFLIQLLIFMKNCNLILMMVWTLHTAHREQEVLMYAEKKLEIYDYDFMRMRVTGEVAIDVLFLEN